MDYISPSPEDKSKLTDRFVSVIYPCFNEEACIPEAYRRAIEALSGVTSNYEIIFVNNGSVDNSAEILDRLVATDNHVTVITLSRNFGSQTAYSAGIDHSQGECAVLIDGDLQDPPELIPQFVERWLEGYQVVYGQRTARKGSIFVRAASSIFYRLFSRLSYIQIPHDVGDFSLIDRRVLDIIKEMPERNRFIRGLRAWAGFRQIGVPYVRAKRIAGKSNSTVGDLFRWASTGLVSFSYAPLEWISLLAGLTVLAAVLAAMTYLALYFVVPNQPRGTETLLLVALIIGAIQLFCLSIIGAYLAKIFEEIKARPRYIVSQVQNDHRSPALRASATDVERL